MIQAADGKFYGVTFGSGVTTTDSVTYGTIWTIDAGLRAPVPTIVRFRPVSGKQGSTVLLQGSHLVGKTAVSFNGVSAAPKVLSANYIRTIVPAGPTSGPVAVSNAGGTTVSTGTYTVSMASVAGRISAF